MTIKPGKNGVLVLCDGCEARWFEANDEPTAEQTVQELLAAGAEWVLWILCDYPLPRDKIMHLCPTCSLDPIRAVTFANHRRTMHGLLTGG